MTPEERARQKIDAMLTASGWVVQEKRNTNLAAARGVAVAELSFKTGEPDYTLFVDARALGTVEAKPEGHSLVGVEEQSAKYVTGVPRGLPAWRYPLPFTYESTGAETRFTNGLDPAPRSRSVFAFHRPETLLEWVQQEKQLAQRLQEFPPLNPAHLWPAQIQTITNLEKSFAAGRPRALIQKATGSGKTFTAVNFTYRLVKYARARRILFLVDRGNLGLQTFKEFQQFVSPVNNYKFTEEYIVQHLTSNTLDKSARIVIATIQRVYSMLKGEKETAPDLDDLPIEAAEALFKEPVPVQYNPAFPIEEFDFIITDECHRSIYNLWRQVLEYFDASLIGLTATPSKQTFGFFQQNLVMEYGHEKAVADGVNVGCDIYRINTQITQSGSKVKAGFFVDKRNRQTRKVRWEQLDQPLVYDPADLDRAVVAPDQIRTVLTTFRDKLFTEIFPGRTCVPKTLIFAKDDNHADDIVRICREVFDQGNDFCQKITYRTGFVRVVEKKKQPDGTETEEITWKRASSMSPEEILSAFRNSYNPRIALTVDMIATGTDIKPLEIVFFMRSVASKNFFEQMKGRGVRVVSDTEMEQVNPGVKRKTRFVIVDAVGVCERVQTESRPLEKKPTVSFEKLLDAAALGTTEPAALESLAGRLIRLERRFDSEVEAEVVKTAKGQTLSQIARGLLDAVDPDKVEEASRLLAPGELPNKVAEASRLSDMEERRRDAAATFSPINYFDPVAPIAFLSGDLPHWRQEGTTYFVTFRLADSLPQEKLQQWQTERDLWLQTHPEPHDEAARREYYELFPQRLQQWLDAGTGSCVLAIPEVKELVEKSLRHFDGQRYRLHEFVVAPNHVHAILSPSGEHTLSEILHSWKSFTAHEILKLPNSGTESGRAVPALSPPSHTIWQKESFDHIVRSPASMEKFRQYIRNHGGSQSGQSGSGVPPLIYYLDPTPKQRRDAAATLAKAALAPLATNPDLRNLLKKIQKAGEQTIDVISQDVLLYAGPAQKSGQSNAQVATSFRDYIEQHKAEITALQILYSRPYKQRLTEPMLKELEKKLRENHAAWTEDRLRDAFAVTAPGKVKGRSQAGRFADLVALVRFALARQPVLKPFAESVTERFNEWLMDKAKQSGSGVPPLYQGGQSRDGSATFFTPDQLGWLNLIRDHIATSLSIEPDDLELSPFNQRGGLGKAHQLFGAELPNLLNELNDVLAA